MAVIVIPRSCSWSPLSIIRLCSISAWLERNVCDCFNNPVDIEDIIGRRLLDYDEMHFDTFSDDSKTVLRATLVFEDDYEMSVDGYNLSIEKHTE